MAKAIAKYIRMSPRKARRVVDMIRGKDTKSAALTLKFLPHAAARVIEKVLKSAVSNAKENENLNPDQLKVVKAFVDESVTLKRWRPMSRGRAYPRMKRSSHITIEVGEIGKEFQSDVKDIAKKASKKAGSKKTNEVNPNETPDVENTSETKKKTTKKEGNIKVKTTKASKEETKKDKKGNKGEK